jgi:hypothetical protein
MIISFLLDVMLLLLLLAVTSAVLLGWGSLAWSILGLEQPTRLSALTVWLGFCSVLLTLEIVHLIVRIDWIISCGTCVVGFLGLRRLRPGVLLEASQDFSRWVNGRPYVVLLIFAVLCFWCLRAMETPIAFDAGLYHFSSIRWLNEEPLVPGLGNLHWRLALNQSYFGFIALMNIAPYWNKGYAAAGLLLLVLTAITVFQVMAKQPTVSRYLFCSLFFIYLNQLAGSLANPSPDIAVSVIELVIFLYLYESILFQNSEIKHNQWNIPALGFLSLTLVTVKLSGIAFAGASLIIVGYIALKVQLPNRIILLKMISLGVLFSLVHIGRNVMLSGAPLFPSSFAGIWSLPWALPSAIVESESALIFAWARDPTSANILLNSLGQTTWLKQWIEQLPRVSLWAFTLSTIFSCLNIFYLIKGWINNYSTRLFLLYFPILSALLFWFFTAPDLRFLGAVSVLYMALTGSLLLENIKNQIKNRGYDTRLHILGGHLARVGPPIGSALLVIMLIRWAVIQPLSFKGWQSVPVHPTKVVITDFGLKVNVPKTGTQCWGAPLPCTMVVYGSLKTTKWASSSAYFGIFENRYMFSIK